MNISIMINLMFRLADLAGLLAEMLQCLLPWVPASLRACGWAKKNLPHVSAVLDIAVDHCRDAM